VPFVTRQRNLASYLHEVFLAPFVFVLVGVWASRWLLLLCLLGFVFCLACDLMMGQPLQVVVGELKVRSLFSWELGGVILGLLGFLWFAAALAAVWDRLRGGQETIWDNRCVELSDRFATLLQQERFAEAYPLCSASLRAQQSPEEFAASQWRVWEEFGQPGQVLTVREFRPWEVEALDLSFLPSAPEADQRAITVVAFRTTSSSQACDLYLRICWEEEDRVTAFAYQPTEEEPFAPG
jgi:hypothetical protein